MTEDSMGVALARLEARLDGIKQQIDHQDRNQSQLVRLVDERMANTQRAFETHLADKIGNIDTKLAGIERRLEGLEARHDRADDRISKLENFNSKLYGLALGSALGGGGIAGLIVKAFT